VTINDMDAFDRPKFRLCDSRCRAGEKWSSSVRFEDAEVWVKGNRFNFCLVQNCRMQVDFSIYSCSTRHRSPPISEQSCIILAAHLRELVHGDVRNLRRCGLMYQSGGRSVARIAVVVNHG
jgi:hypothetical protein